MGRGFLGRLAIAFFRIMAVMVGAGIAMVLYTVPVLAVSQVEVSGNERLSRDMVLALADIEGKILLALDLPAAESRLRSSPWVRQGTVRRQLPATVVIAIGERKPAAVWQTGSDRFLMADDGVLLEQAPPDPALPTIIDRDGAPQQVGGQAPAGPATLAQTLAQELPKAGGDAVAGFEYRSGEGLTVVISGGLRVAFGDGADLTFQLATYQGLLARGGLQKLKIREIDLRFGARPVLRPEQTPTPTPAATATRS